MVGPRAEAAQIPQIDVEVGPSDPVAVGAEAIKLFEEQGFDLVISDVVMPGISGPATRWAPSALASGRTAAITPRESMSIRTSLKRPVANNARNAAVLAARIIGA